MNGQWPAAISSTRMHGYIMSETILFETSLNLSRCSNSFSQLGRVPNALVFVTCEAMLELYSYHMHVCTTGPLYKVPVNVYI